MKFVFHFKESTLKAALKWNIDRLFYDANKICRTKYNNIFSLEIFDKNRGK